MLKRIAATLTALVALLTLAACGPTDATPDSTQPPAVPGAGNYMDGQIGQGDTIAHEVVLQVITLTATHHGEGGQPALKLVDVHVDGLGVSGQHIKYFSAADSSFRPMPLILLAEQAPKRWTFYVAPDVLTITFQVNIDGQQPMGPGEQMIVFAQVDGVEVPGSRQILTVPDNQNVGVFPLEATPIIIALPGL